MHNFHSAYSALPSGVYLTPGVKVNPSNPVPSQYHSHTWFCKLLPFFEQQALFDRLDFTMPTDVSPNSDVLVTKDINSQLLKIPNVSCPDDVYAGLTECYLALPYSPAPGVSRVMGYYSMASITCRAAARWHSTAATAKSRTRMIRSRRATRYNCSPKLQTDRANGSVLRRRGL